ncbi:MAG: hypothetical protein KDD21_08685 [Bacteroidetes bacterium]|nr:hypothetical protein [Bacteroidota bacterium]
MTSLISCSKDDNTPETEITAKKVYVAGAIFNGANYMAVYWKDNEVVNLGSLGDISLAIDIAVANDNTVYACGYSNQGTGNQAVYWKQSPSDNYPNTYNLTATGESVAYDMMVINSDMYVVGYETVSGKKVAVYWKNGEKHQLTDGANNAIAQSIAVNDEGKLFFGGYETSGSDMIGKVWSDFYATTTYNAGVGHSYINSISIPKHNVYAAGIQQQPLYVVTYWKDDVPYTLTDGSSNAFARKIQAVSNNNVTDVYIIGDQNVNGVYTATLWKNDVAQPLTNSTNVTTPYGLFVDGTDVYIAFQENTSTSVTIPKYLKNNVETILPLDGGSSGIVRAIEVK